MGRGKKHRKDRGAFDSDRDDGTIERSPYSAALDDYKPRSGGFAKSTFEDSVTVDALRIAAARMPKFGEGPIGFIPPVKSHFAEGQVVTCPDKHKLRKTDARTTGTVFMLFGAEALVLCRRGHIHRCFISELGAAE